MYVHMCTSIYCTLNHLSSPVHSLPLTSPSSSSPHPRFLLKVQAVSAQGSGNYSDPASFTVESFPAAFIGAIAGGAVLICCGLAVLVVLTLMIGHCCKIRRCVCLCVSVRGCGCTYVRRCVWACVLLVLCLHVNMKTYTVHGQSHSQDMHFQHTSSFSRAPTTRLSSTIVGLYAYVRVHCVWTVL